MYAFLLFSFLLLLLLSLPIAGVIAYTALIPTVFDFGKTVAASTVVRGLISGADSTAMLAVPLFIFAGTLMSYSGISKKIYDIFTFFIGKMPGGMPCAAIITCLFYGAISGSGPATTAAVGMMTIPILVELGYDKIWCAAVIGAAGGLGVIIPPSVPYIMYCAATGASVGDMFIAGIIPGILIAGCMIAWVIFYCRFLKDGNKEKIRQNYAALHKRGFLSIMKDGIWAILSPVIILGGIYSGITTPTEAAVISVVYSLLVALLIYKTMKLKDLPGFMLQAIRSYAPIAFLLTTTTALSRVLTMIQAPLLIQDFVLSHFNSAGGIIAIMIVILVLLGMLIDVTPAILILSPILVPILKQWGVSEIHWGILMTCCLAIGMITPPFGTNLFVASQLVDSEVLKVGKKAYPSAIAFLTAIIIIAAVPQLTLFLLR